MTSRRQQIIIQNINETIIGEEIQLQAAHDTSMQETENFAKKQKTVNDYCCRITSMVKWVQQNYPQYYDLGVVELTNEQKEKKKYHRQTHDFIYDKINIKIIKGFISANKFKADNPNQQYGFVHMRKYHNAIQFGARRAEVQLPQSYRLKMPLFLDSLKKEKTKAKKEGNVTEKEADPITFALYSSICNYAIKVGDLYLWAYTVCQWNCLARSINIDNLSFGQLSLGMDSLIIEYFDSKSDQSGEKTVPKNCFANPFDMHICIFTALGCYLSTQEEVWSGERKTISRSKDSLVGSAAHLYNQKLKALFENTMKDVLSELIRPDHANSHGLRKGGGGVCNLWDNMSSSSIICGWTRGMEFRKGFGYLLDICSCWRSIFRPTSIWIGPK